MGAEVPLEVADPEDQVGDRGGAGVDLDAEELVGVDRVAAFEERLPLGDAFVRAEGARSIFGRKGDYLPADDCNPFGGG